MHALRAGMFVHYYVYCMAEWDGTGTRVDVTTDVVYTIGSGGYPLETLASGPAAPGQRWFLARIERFASLDRARQRGRELQKWPVAWFRPWLLQAHIPERRFLDLVANATQGGRLPVPDRCLAMIDEEGGDPPDRLPRRESWYDGNRPA